jgi:excisionase family DNA binding protein
MANSVAGARLLTAEEVADWLAVTPTWVHEMARSGEIPAIKLGRYWRFSRSAIEDWLAERAQRTHGRRSG